VSQPAATGTKLQPGAARHLAFRRRARPATVQRRLPWPSQVSGPSSATPPRLGPSPRRPGELQPPASSPPASRRRPGRAGYSTVVPRSRQSRSSTLYPLSPKLCLDGTTAKRASPVSLSVTVPELVATGRVAVEVAAGAPPFHAGVAPPCSRRGRRRASACQPLGRRAVVGRHPASARVAWNLFLFSEYI
jgi:hypothetical protein